MERSLDIFVALQTKQPITANGNDKIIQVLKTLRENGIRSLPVKEGGKISLIDNLDILAFILTKLTTFLDIEKLEDLDDNGKQRFRSLYEEAMNSAARSAVGLSRRDQYRTISLSAKMREALDLFVSEPFAFHRIVLNDVNNNPVGIITQFDFIKYVIEHNEDFQPDINLNQFYTRRVSELSQKTPKESVVTIPVDRPALHAFRLMHETGLSSIGIVDYNGVLKGILSASDVQFFLDVNALDLLPAVDFVTNLRKLQAKPINFAVACFPQTPVKDAIVTMLTEDVHRLFIVDNQFHPLGVLSMSDVINELSFAANNTQKQQQNIATMEREPIVTAQQ